MKINWNNISGLSTKDMTCGYCGADISSEKGYSGQHLPSNKNVFLYYCHRCGRLNYFDVDDKQFPGPVYGDVVDDVTDQEVKSLYNEARMCTTVNAFTASVLCSRKLLMNIAVSKGAPEGKRFVEYVEFLAKKGYVPPGGEE